MLLLVSLFIDGSNSPGQFAYLCFLTRFSFTPLLMTFENEAPGPDYYRQRHITPATTDTALLIPCHKSGPVIGRTLEAALKIFPAPHIYVIANGNSSSPLDNTEDICRVYGVNHIWCPVGSKIVAVFVGCYAVKHFRYVLLIDDDCILPPNFPVVVSRLTDHVRCIGYTIKSVNSDSSKGFTAHFRRTNWQCHLPSWGYITLGEDILEGSPSTSPWFLHQ
jgi:hypothetical protein